MTELLIRTEDIEDDEILDFYVETDRDREIVEKLKSRTPIILVGSRGVGKSFLMKVAQQQLTNNFVGERILPVYLTFRKSSLITDDKAGTFTYWMMSHICTSIIRQLRKHGLLANVSSSINILSGDKFDNQTEPRIEQIQKQYENSWQTPSVVDEGKIPTVEAFKDAIDELCVELDIKRIVLFIDEAAHIFIRQQQMQFFTLFRDLRCPKITCNAAVYPGVTVYGDVFQYSQDANFIHIERDVQSDSYINEMKEMVEKQTGAESDLLTKISRQGEYFADLAYACSGNPRFLLKSLDKLQKFQSQEINQELKEFYKVTLLAEHSSLSEKYPSLRQLIDWGRDFIENNVLPELQRKNNESLKEGKATSCFIWINKDTPAPVRNSIKLLEYTGIVQEHTRGIKATRGEVGVRYMVNLGCLFAMEANPTTTALAIAKNLSSKRMTEYGMNSPAFETIKDCLEVFKDNNVTEALTSQLNKNISVLELTPKMKDKLRSVGLNTIKDVLTAPESKLQEAPYVGQKRSRMMKNRALIPIYEYLI